MNSRKPDCKTQQQEENVVPFFRFLKQPEFQVGGPNSITSNSVYISFCCFSFPLRNIDFKAGNKSWINEIGFPWFHVCYRSWGDLAVTPKYAEPHRRSKKKKKKIPTCPIHPSNTKSHPNIFVFVSVLAEKTGTVRKKKERKQMPSTSFSYRHTHINLAYVLSLQHSQFPFPSFFFQF